MIKSIKARFSKGMIEPLERIDLEEGKEFTIIITELSTKIAADAFERSAGGWKETINAEKLIKDIYSDRLIPRPEIKL